MEHKTSIPVFSDRNWIEKIEEVINNVLLDEYEYKQLNCIIFSDTELVLPIAKTENEQLFINRKAIENVLIENGAYIQSAVLIIEKTTSYNHNYNLLSINRADNFKDEINFIEFRRLNVSNAIQLKKAITSQFPPLSLGDISSLIEGLNNDLVGQNEATLRRLELLNEDNFKRNSELRKELEERFNKRETELEVKSTQKEIELQKKAEKEREELQQRIESAKSELLKREQVLNEKLKQIDDSGSKHARRKIREDMKRVLAERNQKFELTKNTKKLRLPVFWASIGLMCLFGGFAYYFVMEGMKIFQQNPSNTLLLVMLVKQLVMTGSFGAVAIFFLRWNNQWFQQHAKEEFKLKRLDLDIDRASWVVEMALEWKEEKGTGIPEELLNRLTKNLFNESDGDDDRKEESALETLLGASSAMKLKVGENVDLSFDRKGAKKIAKEMEE